MPVFGSTPVLSVGLGESVQVWNAEQPTPGTGNAAASREVAIRADQGRSGFAVDGFFSGAPGAFEIDVQVNNIDNLDAHYQTPANGNITAVDTTNNTFHFDGSTILAQRVRLLMRSRTNAVNVTANVSKT